MSVLVSVLLVLATLSFGAVYPWGYLPLFAAAACTGLAGLIRARGIPAGTRGVSVGLLLLTFAIAAQLVPVPRGVLDTLSPHAADLLSRYSLTFAAGDGPHPLSIRAGAAILALFGLTGLGTYLVGLPNLLSRRDLRVLPRNLILFAVLLGLIGAYFRQHNNGLVYGFWRPQQSLIADAFGPFVNRNHFAGWMLMTVCLACGVLCGLMERALESVKPGLRNRILWFSTFQANRIVLVAAGLLAMGLSLIWTLSRSGIVSLVCAVACFVWLAARRSQFGRARRVAVMTMLSVVLLAGVGWRGVDQLVRWFADTRDVQSRLAAWGDGWQVVQDFPIAGTGMNTYPDAMLFYQRHVLDVWMTHAHNDYLQVLAEGGLLVAVPAVIAVALLVIAIRRSLNAARDDGYEYWVRAGASVGLAAIAIQEIVEFSLHIPANAFLFATLAAVALTPIQNPKIHLHNLA
jgi:hypothetical protein